MASMFKRGFDGVKEEKKRQEKEAENRKKGLWRFYLSDDGDEAEIDFLTELPINFYEHSIKSYRNGKEYYDSVPCTGKDCEHCEQNDRPQFKSAWLIIDHREFKYKDKDGKSKTGKDQIRLFVYGTKIAGQLDRKSTRYGLVGMSYTMIRIGKGTSTSYTFENGDKSRYSAKQIEQLLPEALRKDYDGTMDSLYTIIEDQISMLVAENTGRKDHDDTDEDQDEDDEDVRESLVNVDDDEDEDDVPPKRPSKIGAKKTSVKSLLKGRRK